MVSFVISVLSVVGALMLAAVLRISARAEEKRDPTEGMGTWDHVNGKAWRAIMDQQKGVEIQRNWSIGLITWAIASAIFAGVKYAQLMGG